MIRIGCSLLLVCALIATPAARAAEAPAAGAPATATVSGIPLDAPWKATIYAFAQAHFKHPAWGWQHSERDYRLAVEIAHEEGMTVDTDVLFAAAMLHDMAGYPPWEKKGVEHGDVAAVTAEPILRDAGFPMQKYAAVASAESGHMFYSNVSTVPEAIALHDADSIDFLGDMGAARMLAIVGEKAPDVGESVKTLRMFATTIPGRLKTKAAQRMAVPRVAEMTAFLDTLERESYGLR